jgi:hypothetical protein
MEAGVKYLLMIALAGIASVEYFYELSAHDGPGAEVCTAANSNKDPVSDVLRQHLESHR